MQVGKLGKRSGRKEIISALKGVISHGWYDAGKIRSYAGRAGSYLECLLGAGDANSPQPDVGIWELKTRHKNSHSLVTLFQLEPWPRNSSIASHLVRNFGWRPTDTGGYCFRQTLSCGSRTSRGFSLDIRRGEPDRLVLKFDPGSIDPLLDGWKKELITRKSHLDMLPHWRLTDIFHKAMTKLSHCIYVTVSCRTLANRHYVRYEQFMLLSELNLNSLPMLLRDREIVVYFNAHSGHNHGTQFRIKPRSLPQLYGQVQVFN